MHAINPNKAPEPLPESNESYTGASGDGNDPPITDLKRGFSRDADLNKSPYDLMQEKGGFLGRAKGWER